MQFLFTSFNHNPLGQRSLEDIITIMGHQLAALGHKAVYVPGNDQLLGAGAGINIIVEGFMPATVQALANLKVMGGRSIILATEEPTPKGFNWGTQKEMIARQEIFGEAAKHVEGILHLVPGEHVTKWYGQFAPTAPAELGYAPTLMRINQFAIPDYEFGFYGSLTPRRRKVLHKLARKLGKYLQTPKAIKLMVDFGKQDDRDREMQRAKVILQVRKFSEMGLVSSSRCSTSICIGRPVVPEPHTLAHPWDEVIDFPESLDEFFDRALEARKNWQALWAQQFGRFREKMSPERCLGDALVKIGVIEQARAAA